MTTAELQKLQLSEFVRLALALPMQRCEVLAGACKWHQNGECFYGTRKTITPDVLSGDDDILCYYNEEGA